MKQLLLLTALLLTELLSAQVVNRYPYVQRPSQNTATIAWRRANVSTGTLYLGLSPGQWFDSLSTQGLDQKHFFDIAGLQSNTQYYYQVKSIAPNDTFISNIEHFFTAPLPLSDDISFLAYGDCGYNNTMQHQVKALMEQELVDFAIVTGDIDQGIGDDYDNVFFGVYSNMLKKNCHFTCIGNHDTYADNAATYMDDFYLFSNNPANTERYYSYEWGDSKFICLDANLPYTVGTAQYNWMIEELRCNEKKWLFVFFHQPPWTNAWSLDYYLPGSPYFLYEGDEDMRSDLVPRFEEYKVDFVVNGHSHCYQRGALNGVQYLVTGGAGASTLDANTNSSAPNISTEIYENHYVRFDISGDTAKYVMINNLGQRRDSVVVVKSFTHYELSANISDASCNGYADASIQLNVQGPSYSSPYQYLWSTGDSTATLNGLTAGAYPITVTDAFGCARKDTFVVNEPTAINSQIQSSSGSFVICDNDPITLTASGNYPDFLWSTNETTNAIQISNGGIYAVTITDSTNCSTSNSVQVTDFATPSGTTIQYAINNLAVDFSTSIGALYFWDFGDGNSSNAQNPNHVYAAAGTYTVQLIVLNACGSDSTSMQISVGGTGLSDHPQQQLNFSIHPNPFQDYCQLTFDNPQQEPFRVLLSDLSGKVLRSYENIRSNVLEIQKAELSPGIYIYQLIGPSVKLSGRLQIE